MTPKVINVWPWKAGGTLPPQNQPMGRVPKACLQAVIMAAVGAALFFYFKHQLAGWIVWSLAALVLVGGLFVPPVFHAFEKFGVLLAKWVGTGLTYAFLVPFYYLIFLPGRWTISISGRDPMRREFKPGSVASYWIPRKPVRNMDQYRKQH